MRGKPDVSALATLDGDKLCVLAWHYHDDDLPGPDAAIDLTLAKLPKNCTTARVEHFRIDATHSNAHSAWKAIGSPEQLTPPQRAALQQAGQLARLDPSPALNLDAGKASLHFSLPRQAVSLLVVTLTR